MAKNVKLNKENQSEAYLTVDVAELKTCAANIKSMCRGLDGVMASLIKYLQAASKTGLQDGQAADDFSSFVSEISRLNGRLDEIGKSTASVITNFLGAIDDADDLLFKNKGYKSLTDEEFRACYAVTKVANETFLNGFSLRGTISALFNSFFYFICKLADYEVTVGNSESALRKKFEKLEERTAEKLTTIMAGVKSADRTYRQELTQQLEHLKVYEQTLTQVENILLSDDGTINSADLIKLSELIGVEKKLAKKDYTVSDETVIAFADNDNVQGYFDSSTKVIGSICEASLGNLFTTEFDEYRATVNAAVKYFNTYSSQYTESHAKYEKYKGEFDQLLELYQKYGENFADYYNGDKAKVEMFNKLVKKTSKISKKADDYVDIWFQLFCDMSESREAFARFKANYDLNDPTVCGALDRVEALYNGEVDAYVYDTLEHISQEVKNAAVKEGAKAVTEAYANLISGGSGMKTIMSNAVSNILDKAFAEAPAVAQYDWVVTTDNAFDNAVADLKAATPGTASYDTLVKAVRESFDCAKEARIKFFTTMVKNSSGQEKRFYELNLESVKTMSLLDTSRHLAIYPEEFFGETANVFGYILDGDIDVKLPY